MVRYLWALFPMDVSKEDTGTVLLKIMMKIGDHNDLYIINASKS